MPLGMIQRTCLGDLFWDYKDVLLLLFKVFVSQQVFGPPESPGNFCEGANRLQGGHLRVLRASKNKRLRVQGLSDVLL